MNRERISTEENMLLRGNASKFTFSNSKLTKKFLIFLS